MFLETFCCGPFGTNAYLIGCEKTKKGIFIDPSRGSAQKLLHAAKIQGLEIEAIYLTHSHWDHIADVADILEQLPIKLYVHAKDAENLRHPGSDHIPLFFKISGAEPTDFLEEGQQHQIGELLFTIIHTPGHCPGAVCFYFPSEGVLISGDTLFKGTIGNLSLATAEKEKMWPSLKKLAKLPPSTQIYPGHGDSTTLEEESWIEHAQEMFDGN
jgi:glyoxylase-like metal-dependent hydrolase (beta-lactamase superfamily II)